MKTYYVRIGPFYLKKRQSWRISASEDRPYLINRNPNERFYEVPATSLNEAKGVVAYWLASGKPAAMTVREMY